MNQSPTPDSSLDGLLNALRSAATAEELSGEATAISAMASAIADSAEGTSSMNPVGRSPLTRPTFTRARRIVGLTAIGVLGVAGVAAAGAGVFVPDNRPKVETVPSTDDSDDTAVETTVVDDESAESTVPDETTADTTTATDNEQDEAAANKTPADESITPAGADATIVCADGNHGMTVSSVAHATPPGPDHGAAVSAAAHSDCGKVPPTDAAAVDTTVADNHDTKDTKPPKDKDHQPADPGQGNGGGNGNGNGGGNGKGNGNGNGNGNPATIWKGKGG